jgi:hypothetical protein
MNSTRSEVKKMEIIWEVEYPCGYKAGCSVKTGMWDIFGGVNTDFDARHSCPIHGKDCPPKKSK